MKSKLVVGIEISKTDANCCGKSCDFKLDNLCSADALPDELQRTTVSHILGVGHTRRTDYCLTNEDKSARE